ncbi:MAG: integrase family protein [Candidatus Magnetoglobus multicellularis str. Araruama]|uniref:Integrase family protein n=1 Tax=Candidatus Magnetoglobus multicellularis str. Araruama TaxID=890399 RepID=A0A1V1P2V7_9BACT|nr:MAG: integrase family protein [Candidatus Magnetoglobus multicellularis str. Araruama]
MNFLDNEAVQELLNKFLKQKKPSTSKVYRSEIKQFSDFYQGNIHSLSEKDIINYRDSLLSTVTPGTLARKISIINKFLSYVEQNLEGFKNPINQAYGSQAKYQGEYKKSDRFHNDVDKWQSSLHVREGTKKIYKQHVFKFIEWFGESPRGLSKDIPIKYKKYLIDNNYKSSTIWLIFVSMNSFFKVILGEKANEILSFKDLDLIPPKKDKGYYYVLQEHELKKLLEQPDLTTLIGLRDYAMLRMLINFGLRPNELCKIKYGDFENHRVNGQQKLWIRDRKGRANNRPDTAIILNGKVLKAVDEWINNAKISYTDKTPLFNQFKWNIQTETIELDMERISKEKQLTVRSIEKIVESYVIQSGLKSQFKISPHALRHSALTLLAKSGVELIDLKYLAGHQDISTTMIYIHSVQTYEDHVGMYHPLNK